ncbi:MAG TPA: DUF4190 domain-containing protein [Actinospica sp.]|nr:DUF4190 domain-containing protein [Actinospica sp.]
MSQQPSDEPSDQQPSPFPQYPQQQYPAAPPLGGEYGGSAPGYPGGGYGDPDQYGPPRTSKLAITSLVLGIISLPLLFIGVGILFALVGLILGIIGIAGARRKNLKRGIGIAGIVLSLIGLIGGGLLIVAVSNAASSCKSLNHAGNNTAYTNCIKHNLRL